MKPALALLLVVISGCASLRTAESVPTPQRLDCYRLPAERWSACLEQARAIGFNVYECERRALYGPALKEIPRNE